MIGAARSTTVIMALLSPRRVVRCLARRYWLAIVSLVTASDYQARVTERLTVLRDEGLAPYFSVVLFAPAEKYQLYEARN